MKDWNARYRWPRFVISDQHAPFAALEQRYGDRIPTRRGDWTPYWEDGAGSSSRETAMNRASADRMTQAETVWALRSPEAWPAAAADAAWKKVLLYTEHTWGAWNSVSQPEERFVKDQWDIKRGYAEEADWLSRKLLAGASPATEYASVFDVVNTLSWARTDVVRVPGDTLGRRGPRPRCRGWGGALAAPDDGRTGSVRGRHSAVCRATIQRRAGPARLPPGAGARASAAACPAAGPGSASTRRPAPSSNSRRPSGGREPGGHRLRTGHEPVLFMVGSEPRRPRRTGWRASR